jgi:hypothetical protein
MEKQEGARMTTYVNDGPTKEMEGARDYSDFKRLGRFEDGRNGQGWYFTTADKRDEVEREDKKMFQSRQSREVVG